MPVASFSRDRGKGQRGASLPASRNSRVTDRRGIAAAKRFHPGGAARCRNTSRLPEGPWTSLSALPRSRRPQRHGRRGHPVDGLHAERVVAHHAALHQRRPELELRLHHRQHLGPGREHLTHRGEHLAQTDEAHVDDHQRDGLGHHLAQSQARVHALPREHPGVGPEALVELVMPHVHRPHPRRAALQQQVGEATRRRPEVEAHPPRGVDPERGDHARELQSPAGHIRARVLREGERGVFGDHRARLVDALLPEAHAPREEHRLRALPRRHEAPRHHEPVNPLPRDLRRHGLSAPSSPPRRPASRRPAPPRSTARRGSSAGAPAGAPESQTSSADRWA
jgi:hypothetical protein